MLCDVPVEYNREARDAHCHAALPSSGQPSCSRAIRPVARAFQLSLPRVPAGAGYRQVCVGTNPSVSVCAWCYKADSLPCLPISFSFPGCKQFLCSHPKRPAFRSSHSFASLLRSCLGLSARLMPRRCQEFDLQLLPGPLVQVGTGRGAEKAGKR